MSKPCKTFIKASEITQLYKNVKGISVNIEFIGSFIFDG
jgi:hypothetical protein